MNNIKKENTDIPLDALNHIPSGVGVFDVANGTIELKYLNDGFYQMIDASREDRTQFFGTGTIHSVHPDDRPGLLKEMKASLQENRLFEYRFRNLNGQGDYIWIGIRASHAKINETTERFYASYFDVHQIVSEKNEADKSSQKLNSIMDQIPGGIAVFTEQNRIVHLIYTNPGFYQLHHGSREYWDGQSKNPLDWITPEDRDQFWDEFNRVRNGEKPSGSISYRIVGEDQKFHWVKNEFSPAECINGLQYYYASFVDEDEQVEAEQQLLQNKLMYDDAARSAKLIIWSYDMKTRQVTMMQSGYTAEICQWLHVPTTFENPVDTMIHYVEPQDQDAFRNVYREIENGAETASCEFHFQMPGHSSLQLERITLRRINDKNGHLVNIYGIGQNLSYEREKEEDYERAYRQLEQIYPHSLGSFHLNLTRNWCGKGRSALDYVMKQQESGTVDGYFLEFSKLIADEDVKKEFFQKFDRKLLLEDFEKGKKNLSIEYPTVYTDGTRHWRNGLLFMIRNPKTNDIEAVTYAVDIDERKKKELVMEKLTHEHFDYIGIIHPSTKTFEFCSRRSWMSFGRTGEVFPYEQGCQYIDQQFTNEEERKAFAQMITLDVIWNDLQQNGTRSTSYLKTVNGIVTCTKLFYTWLEQKGGDILVIRSDATDAYAKEQHQLKLLEEEKNAAEAASHAKSEFISRISHDIRTPIGAIRNMTTFAREDIQNQDNLRNDLDKIDSSSTVLLSLINDVLDISKIDSGRIELHPEPYGYEEYIENIRNIFEPLCQHNGQTFLIRSSFNGKGHGVLVDHVRYNQITFNLLSNAVKYTPAGGTITYESHAVKLPDGMLECSFEISDTGIGMSKEFQKNMFEPFSQEMDNPERLKLSSGTGLGLSIVKRLVTLMGGRISVESDIGKGTKFTVSFVLPEASIDQKKYGESSDTSTIRQLSGRILLVEDNAINIEIVTRILTSFGLQSDTAENGKQGVELFRQAPADHYLAVLMDLQMPIMNGYEATRALRSLDRPDAKTIPIIAMSADAFEDSINTAKKAGINEYITKPILPEKVYQVLSRAYDSVKACQ